MGKTHLCPEGPTAFEALRRRLMNEVGANALGEPIQIAPLFSGSVGLTCRVSLWARGDTTVERVRGRAPLGAVAPDAATARAELEPGGRAAASDGAFAKSLEAALREDPWSALSAWDGAFVGRPAGAFRSVIIPCRTCGGEGFFRCPSPARDCVRDCAACDGTGSVDQVCRVCGGAGKVDPSGLAASLGARLFGSAAAETACPACSGAGATRETCSECLGAARIACTVCDAQGRTSCTACNGEGANTERYSAIAQIEHSLRLVVGDNAPPGVAQRLRDGYAQLAEARAFTPRLVSLRTEGAAHLAEFNAEVMVTVARVEIGRRMPRLIGEVCAAGDPPVLLDPPKLIDGAHQRALDRAALHPSAPRAAMAATLAKSALGRDALAAAARGRPRFDGDATLAFASPTLATRVFDVARGCHALVGWRRRTWLWVAAAAAAPLLAIVLMAAGLQAPAPDFRGLTSGSAAELARDGVALLQALAPYLVLWLAAVAAFGALYARAARRVIGVRRRASFSEILSRSPGPAAALAIGAALYVGALYAPNGLSSGLAADLRGAVRGVVAGASEGPSVTAAASVDAAQIETGSIRAERRPSETPAPAGMAEMLARASSARWRVVGATGIVRAAEDGAGLMVLCDAGQPTLALSAPRLDGPGRVQMMVDGRMNGQPRRADADPDRPSTLIWASAAQERRLLEAGDRLRVFVSTDSGAITSAYNFSLTGFTAAAGTVLAGCRR